MYSLLPPPTQTAVDRNGGQLSTTWMQWFVQLFNFVMNMVDFTQPSVQVPVNAFSIQMADKVQVLTLDPAGALAAGTITLAVTPYDGQFVQVSSTQTITSLTLAASGSATLKNAPTTLIAGIGFSYYYRASNTTWYRLS